MRLDAHGCRAPAVGLRAGGSLLEAAKHDSPCEDGCLAAVIRGHLVLGSVDEDICMPCALAARLFRAGVLVAGLGRGGRIARPRGRGVEGFGGREGEARARV